MLYLIVAQRVDEKQFFVMHPIYSFLSIENTMFKYTIFFRIKWTDTKLLISIIKVYLLILKWSSSLQFISVLCFPFICFIHLLICHFNPIYLTRGPICPQDIFYSISLVFGSPIYFPVECSMQIIRRLQRKQKCKILASQTFLITILWIFQWTA